MDKSRRSFLKKSLVLGAGFTGMSMGVDMVLASGPASGKGFVPAMGVCTAMDNRAVALSSGCGFIEEGVSRLLVPDKPDSEFEKNLAILENHSLKVLACNGFIPGNMRLTGPELKHNEALNWAEIALRRAGKAGVKYIVLGSGTARRIPEGFDSEKARDQFVDFCKQVGKRAEGTGVTVVIEPLNKGETNFINTVTEGADIVKRVNHKSIMLLCDLYHMMKDDEGPESIIKAGKYIKHCHIAEKETRSAPGIKGDDFRPYFNALKKIKYKGAISIECGWNDFKNDLPVAISVMQNQWNS